MVGGDYRALDDGDRQAKLSTGDASASESRQRQESLQTIIFKGVDGQDQRSITRCCTWNRTNRGGEKRRRGRERAVMNVFFSLFGGEGVAML